MQKQLRFSAGKASQPSYKMTSFLFNIEQLFTPKILLKHNPMPVTTDQAILAS